ncbi:hypothetical protein ACFS7Z_23265 [Pontibacter toksunensis]|uniref:SpoIIAA-like protein n=1 Tax=Pontibacter toksunensis TaxID=1332631 RepID=A0ABW6C0E4_9BACT
MELIGMELVTVLDIEYVSIRHNPEEKFMWNEWRESIPSQQLREAMMFACDFILDNEVELILADYTRMHATTVEDQVWIATHSAEKLQHSRLRKVANVMAHDVFQQIAIENIYEKASEIPLPCVSEAFFTKEAALDWLFSDKYAF